MIIHTSNTPSIRVNDLFCGNIYDFIVSGGHSTSSKASGICATTGESISHAQQHVLARKMASILSETGFGANFDPKAHNGEVLMTLSANSIYSSPVHWAALIRGGTVSPASVSYTVNELAHQVRTVKPKVIVASKAKASLAKKAVQMARLKCVVLELESLVQDANKHPEAEPVKFNKNTAYRRVAYLAMSSGTSGGTFKAVKITHFNITSCIQVCQKSAPNRDTVSQIASAVIPVSHLYGLSKFLIMAPYVGSTTVFHEKFEIREFLDAQKRFQVNSWPIVPPLVVLLTNHPLVKDYTESLRAHLRIVCCGAAPLGEKAARDFLSAVTGSPDGVIQQQQTSRDKSKSRDSGFFSSIRAHVADPAAVGITDAKSDTSSRDQPRLQIIQGWGLTETSPTCTTFDPLDPNLHIKACGKIVANTEIRIRGQGQDYQKAPILIEDYDAHPSKETLPIGEIYVRGPQVTLGYLNDSHADETSFEQCYDPHVPWFHLKWFKTGDVGFIDRKGRIMVVDRTKEMIKSMGKQVAPAEIEDLLLSHELVADAAVIGVSNEKLGTESPRAFVVPKSGFRASDLRSWTDKLLPKHKQLHGGIVIVDKVPKNASGKILRRVLRERRGDLIEGVAASKL
ncbi:4-coumarate--CoA ligase-like 1 [Yarrowia sp. B02]|nr:4-coumarate--CoA ligase-like 1 [Yarrowia sp. B02]